jgi:hypothetical protein
MNFRSLVVLAFLTPAFQAWPVLAHEKAPHGSKEHIPPGKDIRSCDGARTHATQINYRQLLDAAAACDGENRPVDARYFYLLSQIRIAVDSELLYRRGKNGVKMWEALGVFRAYRGGGDGPDEFYRDGQRAKKLFSDLLAWRAQILPGYSPGWDYKRLPPADFVKEVSDRTVFNRVAELKWATLLLRNDVYYLARKRTDELFRANNGKLSPNTPASAEFKILRAKKAAVRQKLRASRPIFRSPKQIYVDPDADFRPLFVGKNGPKTGRSGRLPDTNYIQARLLDRGCTE